MTSGKTSDPRAPAPRVLILFAHPAFDKSRVNRVLGRAVQQVPGVTFHDLYQAYPDFDIDVAHEQRLLLAHDVIVFQHPLFWYSTPAILKEWQDLVLEHNWAYGAKGTALRGKRALTATTTGGAADAYQRGGLNRFTLAELLAPIAQTWHLCGVEYLAPFVVHGTLHLSAADTDHHARAYRAHIEHLRDGGGRDDAR